MKKTLFLLLVVTACGSETQEDRMLDEMNDSMREFSNTCNLCLSSNIVPSVSKVIEESEAEDTLCWTWGDGGLTRLGVGLKSSYMKGKNLKSLINQTTQDCVSWAGS